MTIETALKLITKEEESNHGLLILFRLSSDVEEEKIQTFIEALKVISQHYENKVMIEKKLVNQLMWFYRTLGASASHWKVSHPKGLTPQVVFEIQTTILDVFTNDNSSPLS